MWYHNDIEHWIEFQHPYCYVMQEKYGNNLPIAKLQDLMEMWTELGVKRGIPLDLLEMLVHTNVHLVQYRILLQLEIPCTMRATFRAPAEYCSLEPSTITSNV